MWIWMTEVVVCVEHFWGKLTMLTCYFLSFCSFSMNKYWFLVAERKRANDLISTVILKKHVYIKIKYSCGILWSVFESKFFLHPVGMTGDGSIWAHLSSKALMAEPVWMQPLQTVWCVILRWRQSFRTNHDDLETGHVSLNDYGMSAESVMSIAVFSQRWRIFYIYNIINRSGVPRSDWKPKQVSGLWFPVLSLVCVSLHTESADLLVDLLNAAPRLSWIFESKRGPGGDRWLVWPVMSTGQSFCLTSPSRAPSWSLWCIKDTRYRKSGSELPVDWGVPGSITGRFWEQDTQSRHIFNTVFEYPRFRLLM